MSHPSSTGRDRRRLFRVLALVAGTVVALGLAEISLRCVLAYRFRGDLQGLSAAPPTDENADLKLGDFVYPVADDDLIYRLRPGARGRFHGAPVRINALGFHDDETKAEKPAGVIRIVALGDSSSFAWGVEREEGYLEVLEGALSRLATPKKVEVINTAVPGYNAVMEVELFHVAGVALKPDLVLIQYSYNDGTLPDFIRDKPAYLRLDRLYVAEIPAMLTGRAGDWVAGVLKLEHNPAAYQTHWGKPGTMDEREVPERYRQHLGRGAVLGAYARLKATCDKLSIPLFVVLPAEIAFEWEPDAKADPHYDEIREICAELKLPVIETFPLVREFVLKHGIKSEDLAVGGREDWHPNAVRHLLMARSILPAVAGALGGLGAGAEAISAENQKLEAAAEARFEKRGK